MIQIPLKFINSCSSWKPEITNKIYRLYSKSDRLYLATDVYILISNCQEDTFFLWHAVYYKYRTPTWHYLPNLEEKQSMKSNCQVTFKTKLDKKFKFCCFGLWKLVLSLQNPNCDMNKLEQGENFFRLQKSAALNKTMILRITEYT